LTSFKDYNIPARSFSIEYFEKFNIKINSILLVAPTFNSVHTFLFVFFQNISAHIFVSQNCFGHWE